MSITVEPRGKSLWFSIKQKITGTKLYRVIGIDRAIAFTILARGWSSFAGLVTLALIARFLSPAEQGYYYTFGSLIALQIVFELGFSFVILQMASHERAHLQITFEGVVTGDAVHYSRLASVLQKTIRWYASAAIFLLTFLMLAGLHFFAAHNQTGAQIAWQAPWLADAAAATCTFLLDPMLSFMEGCGFVPQVARLRFGQAAFGSILAWIVLATHHGLFAPAATISGYAIVAGIWLFRRRALLFPLLRHDPSPDQIGWMSEVWPFQWRIAVSWLCGYFIFQLYNPVLFAYRGAVAAGQMGMSLSLSNALSAIAVSWINTKAAPFGALIARKEYNQLDSLFFRSSKQAVGVALAGGGAIWLIALLLRLAHQPFAHRILDPLPLAILLFTTSLNMIMFAQAVYLRAHKQEKYLLNSILGAILVSASTFFLGRAYGALGIVIGSVCVGLFMGLPLGTYTFIKYRRIWHGH